MSNKQLVVYGCERSGVTLMKNLISDGFGVSTIESPDMLANTIGVIRDPRDVITSRDREKPGIYCVTPEKWLSYAETISTLKGRSNAIVVRFEDLVRSTNKTQKAIANKFNLAITKESPQNNQEYESRVSRWKRNANDTAFVLQTVDDNMRWLMSEFGYI